MYNSLSHLLLPKELRPPSPKALARSLSGLGGPLFVADLGVATGAAVATLGYTPSV